MKKTFIKFFLVQMKKIRPCVHAGTFYPADHTILTDMLMSFYLEIDKYIFFDKYKNIRDIVSVFVPHAGYIYSGIIATAGYKIFQLNKKIDTLIMVGPAHYDAIDGWLLSDYDALNSPLGVLYVDKDIQEYFLANSNGQFKIYNKAHDPEHSLEVQLPFIKMFLNVSKIIPVLAGIEPDIQLFSELLLNLIKKEKNIGLLISTDLSHYLPYDKAVFIDNNTLNKFLIGDLSIGPYEACGYNGLNLMIHFSKKIGYMRDVILYANSGDTSGNKDQVVGYATGILYKQ